MCSSPTASSLVEPVGRGSSTRQDALGCRTGEREFWFARRRAARDGPHEVAPDDLSAYGQHTSTTRVALLDELRQAAQAGQSLVLGDRPEEDRTLDGSELRSLYLRLDGVDPTGVTIAGARVTGRLDLSGVTLAFPVWFEETTFDEPVGVMWARVPMLSFDRCALPALSARRLSAEGGVALNACTIRGGVSLENARLGDVDCQGTTIEGSDGVTSALALDGASIDGDVMLSGGFTARGEVSLQGARVAGRVGAMNACVETSTGAALTLTGAEVARDVSLTGLRARGEVRGIASRVGGSLSLQDATLEAMDGEALSLDQISVAGDVHLRGLTARGRVSLESARVGHTVFCSGATIENPGGEALSLWHAEVGALVHLDETFRAAGTVLLSGAHVRGDLVGRGATIEAEGSAALEAVDTTIDGSLVLTKLVASGTVDLLGTRVGSMLMCDEARLDHPGCALRLVHADVGANVLLNSLQSAGWLMVHGTRVGGDLVCTDVTLTTSRSRSLIVAETEVGGQVLVLTVSAPGLSFVSTRAAVLHHDVGLGATGLGSWSGGGRTTLDGFAYERFDDFVPRLHVRHRIRWLESTFVFEPAAWLHLAGVLRASGRDSDATRVLIAMQNDRIRRGGLSPAARLGRQILRITIGHGYRPWLAGAWAAAVIAAFAVVVWQASELFIPAKDGVRGAPQPVVYAADTFLPIVDFGQAGDWDPTGWTRWFAWAVIAVGWALTTIFVGGFTKLVRSV
jgi:hypothetical protein